MTEWNLLKRRLYLTAERLGIRQHEWMLLLVLAMVSTGLLLWRNLREPEPSPFSAETYAGFRAEFDARAKQALVDDSIQTARFFHPEAVLAAGEGAEESKKTPRKEKPAKTVFPVNINTAPAVELEEIPGIGPKMAADILDFRQKNGPFTSLDDLQKIKGIGPKKLEKMKPYVQL